MTPVTVEVDAIEVVSTSDLFSGLDAPVRSQAIGLDNEFDSEVRKKNESDSQFWFRMGQICAQMEEILKPTKGYEKWVERKAKQLDVSGVTLYQSRQIAKLIPEDKVGLFNRTALIEITKTHVSDDQRQAAIEAAEQHFDATGKSLNKNGVTAVLKGDYARVKELYESIDGFEEVDGVFRKQSGKHPYVFEMSGKSMYFNSLEHAEESIPVAVECIAKKLEGRDRVKRESKEAIEQAKLAPQPWDEWIRSQGFLRCENGVDEESILFSDRHCGFGVSTDGLTVYLERQGYYWACKTELVDSLEGDYEELIAYGKRVIDDIEETRTGIKPGTSLNNLRSEPGTGSESNPGVSVGFYTQSGKTDDGRDRDKAYTPEKLWKPALEMFGIKQFELDPFTDGNATVPAAEQWTEETDKIAPTLTREWRKPNGEPYSFVWINHPWSISESLVPAVLQKIQEDGVENVIWLAKNDCRTKWWGQLLEAAGVMCAVQGSVKFGSPDRNHDSSLPMGVAIFPIALFDFDVDSFAAAYESVGKILVPYRQF